MELLVILAIVCVVGWAIRKRNAKASVPPKTWIGGGGTTDTPTNDQDQFVK